MVPETKGVPLEQMQKKLGIEYADDDAVPSLNKMASGVDSAG
jgi:hypothetical protein